MKEGIGRKSQIILKEDQLFNAYTDGLKSYDLALLREHGVLMKTAS